MREAKTMSVWYGPVWLQGYQESLTPITCALLSLHRQDQMMEPQFCHLPVLHGHMYTFFGMCENHLTELDFIGVYDTKLKGAVGNHQLHEI